MHTHFHCKQSLSWELYFLAGSKKLCLAQTALEQITLFDLLDFGLKVQRWPGKEMSLNHVDQQTHFTMMSLYFKSKFHIEVKLVIAESRTDDHCSTTSSFERDFAIMQWLVTWKCYILNKVSVPGRIHRSKQNVNRSLEERRKANGSPVVLWYSQTIDALILLRSVLQQYLEMKSSFPPIILEDICSVKGS